MKNRNKHNFIYVTYIHTYARSYTDRRRDLFSDPTSRSMRRPRNVKCNVNKRYRWFFGSYLEKWWPKSTSIIHHDFHATFSNHFTLNVRETYNYWKPVGNFFDFQCCNCFVIIWIMWRSYASWFPLKMNAAICFWLCCGGGVLLLLLFFN